MKKMLTHNLSLKILAVLFSAGLWLISININDPVSPKYYTVSVQLLNLNTMTNAGKYVEVLDDTDTIRITVRASRTAFTNFSEKNLVATADINEMTSDNRIPIEVTTTKMEDKIESIKADKQYVSVRIEDITRIQKTIEVVVQNSPASGYLLGQTNTDQTAVIASGPESLISRIASARVEINVDGATSDVNMSRPIRFYDEEDVLIDDERLTTSVSNVSTTATILQKKEVPIECTVSGEPSSGYLFTGEILSDPVNVIIAGKPGTVRNITKIAVTEPISITGAEKDVVEEIDVRQYLPEGLILADGASASKITVTAKILKEESKTVEISSDRIHLMNVPEGYTVRIHGLEDAVELRLRGLRANLDEVNASTLQGYVDIASYMQEQGMEELEEGNFYPLVKFELPENVFLRDGLKVHIVVEKNE